jgi:pyruvate dehydrogenase (quinone)
MASRPVVLEVKTDPEVVPLPPHMDLKAARGGVADLTF